MAIIYSYPYVSTVNNSDTLVISVSDTTADNGFLTKSLTADDLASYVTARVNLNFLGDTGTGVVNLDTQNLSITGTANEIETAASSQTLQIGLPDSVTITNNLTIGGTLNVTGQSTLSSVNVTDLTSGRVVLVGTSGELQDDSDLTFTGSTLTATNIVVTDQDVNGQITVVGLTDTGTLSVQGSSEMQGILNMASNNINNVANPVAAQDAATKAYVDGLVSGGLSFRGSFRADTGQILSGANSGSYLYNCPGGAGTRVAVSTGDYYIVANTGGQFYCSGDLLNIGDSVMAVADAAADSSTINDWATLESDNVEGTGIANTIPVWTDSQVLGNSMLSQNASATQVTITGNVVANGVIRATNAGQAFRAEAGSGSGFAVTEFENTNRPLYRLRDYLGTDTVKIKATGDSFFTGGKVGIGINQPASGLDVFNSSSFPVATISGTNATGVGLVVSKDSTNTGDMQRWQYRSGTIKALVDSEGKFGIGLTNPLFSVDVFSDKGIRTRKATSTDGFAIVALNSLSTPTSACGIYYTNNVGSLILNDTTQNQNVKIQASGDSYIKGGRVGIGDDLTAARSDTELFVKNGDIQLDRPDSGTDGGGIILQTPDKQNRYKITIDNNGNLVSTQV